MVRVAADRTIIEANPSFCTMLGTSAGAAMGGPIGRYFPAEEMALADDELKKLANHVVESIGLETQASRLDESTIWLHWTATAVENRSGDLDYFVVMFEDVSERRSTEDALKAAYA